MSVTDSKPVCDYCEHVVPDGFWYVINGDVICKECLDDNFRQGSGDDEE